MMLTCHPNILGTHKEIANKDLFKIVIRQQGLCNLFEMYVGLKPLFPILE